MIFNKDKTNVQDKNHLYASVVAVFAKAKKRLKSRQNKPDEY